MDQGRPAIRAADPLIGSDPGREAVAASRLIGGRESEWRLRKRSGTASPARASFINDPWIRGIVFQIVVFVGLVAFVWWIVGNTIENLQRANIASGFGFLERARRLRRRPEPDRVLRRTRPSAARLLVGLLNTLLVAVVGIITATILGFMVGIGRLSHNWLIRKISTVYVEIFRNIPPLLVIFFWYLGVLSVLPLPRDSYHLPFGSYLNNRGFFLPKPIWGERLVADRRWPSLLAIAMSWFVARRARQRQMATGQQFPVFWTSLGADRRPAAAGLFRRRHAAVDRVPAAVDAST